jgi:hypothetical protein
VISVIAKHTTRCHPAVALNITMPHLGAPSTTRCISRHGFRNAFSGSRRNLMFRVFVRMHSSAIDENAHFCEALHH